MPSLNDWRPYSYEVPTTFLDVQIFDDHVMIDSIMDFERKLEANEESLLLNGSGLDDEGFGLELISAKVNGVELDNNEFHCDDTGLTIHSVPSTCEVRVRQKIAIPDRAVDGMYYSGQTLITQCEDESFRKIAFYPDRPDVLSKWRVRIEAPKERYPVLLSNGDEIAHEDVSDSRHVAIFEDPFAKPCYLFALAAGKLASLHSTFTTTGEREVQLSIYADEKSIRYCTWAMVCLKDAMRWDERAYNRVYDLDRFAIVAVEKFVFGAMENKSLNVFNNLVLLAHPAIATDDTYERIQAVVGHEYFHNYSGNRVTVRDWFQLSLKEGFTVLRDQSFSRYMNGFDASRIRSAELLRREQFPEAQCGLAHPVRPTEMRVPANYYTRTIYEGGAEIAYMLSNRLGSARWRQATDHYFDKHDGEAVTIDDFVDAIAENTEQDLSKFKLWYATVGTPVLDIEESRDAGDICLRIKQSIPSNGEAAQTVLEIPLGIGVVDNEGENYLSLTETTPSKEEVEIDTDVEFNAPKPDNTLVFKLNRSESEIRFKNVPSKAYVSVLRDFSAPVEVRYFKASDGDVDIERIKQLSLNDSNRFSRYDATQQLFMGAILNYDTYFDSLADAVERRLNWLLEESTTSRERGVIACELALPYEGRVLDLNNGTTVESITVGMARVERQLAIDLADKWRKVSEKHITFQPYEYNEIQCANRRLRALAFRYLLAQTSEDQLAAFADDMASYQRDAKNLTDRMAYFKLLLRVEGQDELKESAAVEFYEKFKNESLVVEKWIAALVGAPSLDAQARIAKLDEIGLLKNATPNRWRSVFHTFSENWENFHLSDGSGYRYYTDRLIADAPKHGSVVRRAIQPLAYWHRYDEKRSILLRACLERLDEELPRNDVPSLDMVRRGLQILDYAH